MIPQIGKLVRLLLLGMILTCLSAISAESSETAPHPDVARAVVETARDAYSSETTAEALSDNPIGIFDSDTGGLTVMESILTMDEYDNESGRPGGDGEPDFATVATFNRH